VSDDEAGEAGEDGPGLAEALAGWGMTETQVAETLEATDFGFGLVELGAADGEPSRGVAIVVDDRRDERLRELFAWRKQATDEEYAAGWATAGPPHVRVVLGPDEQALVRFGITISAPAPLERRYLFAVPLIARVLAKMQIPGTGIWLVPATVIEKEAAGGGPRAAYEVADRCLQVGVIERAVPSIDEALAHVGAPRESETMRPMNRAERRAAAKGKKQP
jgi:hypothetical protein